MHRRLPGTKQSVDSYGPVSASAPAAKSGGDDDDDDFDLFGDDEEEDDEKEKLKAERIAAYEAKKTKSV